MNHEDLDAVIDGVGARMKELRTRRGLRLADVSESTGVSISILSRLESGLRNPSLDVLLKIARVFHVPLDELVGAPASGDPRVHPKPVRRHGMIFIPLTTRPIGVQAFKVILPGREPDIAITQSIHVGYEWLFVLTGTLHLKIGAELTILGAGEVAEFDTAAPHGMASGSMEPVEVLTLFSAQGEQIHIRDA
ncbi:helix-turn-helix domain-containing protein [Gordonia sp. HY002]|uniref:helix-turn-helix domain-containing protein n=1 Tax=Gordonia zhenghanii TaxID=2911516 RepID=UPI001EF0C42A|nr:helix-turn-helix domain-containing protein [Gordonia zhenghanii]MCF8572127.1 helix-turn-helix domain-containing protein [Gordonia zhenghanii]MCF8604289.1 helix-turn-helix domain-containing protein [Gordonia zhenghanii]